MAEINFTVIHKRATPPMQAVLSLAIGWVGMGICHFLEKRNGQEFFVALTALILYSIINTVVSIAYRSYLRYALPSLYLYVGLVIVLFLSAKLSSGISIWKPEMNEYRMMLISVSIFYVLISHLVRVIRALYNAFENEM